MKRILVIAMSAVAYASAYGQSLSLTAHNYANIYSADGQTLIDSAQQTESNTWSGSSISAGVISGATAYAPGLLAPESANASQTIDAVTNGGFGTFTIQDSYNFQHPDYGSGDGMQGPESTYTYNVSQASTLYVGWNQTGSATDPFFVQNGNQLIGLWTTQIYVDGVVEQATQIATTDGLSGNFQLSLGAGLHTISLFDNGNVGVFANSPSGQMSMNETISFYTAAQAVPEPTPFIVLGLGALVLLIRRRS